MNNSLVRQFKWILAAALTLACAAQAATVSYSVNALGGDLWRYNYTLDNTAGAAAFDEFTVYFDLPGVSALVGFTSPAGWDSLIVQPDTNLPDAGYFDALHLAGAVAPGSTAAGFSVDFLVAPGQTPGAQRFDLVTSANSQPVFSGITSAVPEPGSGALMLAGLAGVAGWGWARLHLRARLQSRRAVAPLAQPGTGAHHLGAAA